MSATSAINGKAATLARVSRKHPRVSTRAVIRLAFREARRTMLHPVYGLAVGYLVIASTAEVFHGTPLFPDRQSVINAMLFVFVFLFPVIALFPSNLVATSARRAGASDLMAALPVSRAARATAFCLSTLLLAAPALAASIVATRLINGASPHLDNPPWPVTIGTMLSVPLIWIGAGVLGVAVARWLPWPGMPLLTVFALITWTASAGNARSDLRGTAPWLIDEQNLYAIAPTVSSNWHAVYLAGLCLLAATAAVLRDKPWRLVEVGAPVGAGTLLTAWLQLS
jgi:ABC-type multidrug transport system permease subunit